MNSLDIQYLTLTPMDLKNIKAFFVFYDNLNEVDKWYLSYVIGKLQKNKDVLELIGFVETNRHIFNSFR
jgi:hypothetical protein